MNKILNWIQKYDSNLNRLKIFDFVFGTIIYWIIIQHLDNKGFIFIVALYSMWNFFDGYIRATLTKEI